MADRWLAKVQTLSGTGDMLLAEQGIQDHQQVEVDAAQIIHQLHARHKKLEFKFARRIA
ncbi:hypothetical protein [Pseudomonas sp. AU10]|uniref:hypothetical protein n=1 Tax=Pseudomonas sp. AU10 TaxID=882697 RepID=UPI0021E29F8A|nr:hypothetical protein [Pseudomonas sp. AU10]MCV2227277.1 hypothetical protein [Pseudomonas sp. AU10]